VRDLRQADGDCYPLAGRSAVSVLQKRVESLEASEAASGDGGCGRCRGTLITVHNCISGELHSASWNGEAISEEELAEREVEKTCPECGRSLDDTVVIKVGGGPLP
jgi:hypothetical protein